MNLLETGKRLLGFDNGEARYGYKTTEMQGPVSASRAADTWVKTTCGYCSVGCGMLLGVRDGKAVAVQGDPDHPVNRGRLCPKGLSEHLMIAAEGRLLTPTLGGKRTTWTHAITTMVDTFKETIAQHGPGSVAIISTGQLLTEEFYTLGKLARLGMGLRHLDGNTTLCMSSAVAGYKMSFGTDGPPGCYEDLEQADIVVLWGANIADNHPLLAPRLLYPADGVRPTIIAVDPRVTKTAMVSDIHMAVKPRGDIALLNGIMRSLLDEKLVDLDDLRVRINGIDDLVAHLADWPVERAANESGIEADMIRDVAGRIGRAERVVLAWTMGVNHSVQGTMTVTLLNTLALLTGNIGKPGAAPLSITGQCNAMGTRETGFTASMPGYRAYDNPSHRAELATLWGVDETRLPVERGYAYPDIINATLSGKIKALWIIGTNPVVSYPNREILELALSRLTMLVVQDGFETPTTALADIVLPAAIWGEKEGTYTNTERRVSRVRAAVAPPGEAMSDFDIFQRIAVEWGCADLLAQCATPVDAFNEWRTISAGRPCDYSEITYDRIDAEGGVQWPNGAARLYSDGVFNHTDGKAKVFPVNPQPIRDRPRGDFPFMLNTGRTVEHWHTRTKTGRIAILEGLAPEAWVELHPSDADNLGVFSGDFVRVSSSRGAIDRIRARITTIVRPGEVFIPFHWDDRCVNRLTPDEFDPISKEPNYKQSAVKIERVGAR
jgi:anaerobic selenocysteine-containing dehydrogenase